MTAASGGSVRRAVVLVGTPAAPYSRGLRMARALAQSGFRVEIAAVATDDVPDLEMDGPVTIRRYRPSGRFASMAATHRSLDVRSSSAAAGSPVRLSLVAKLGRLARIGRIGRAGASVRRWVFWPHTVRAWWATLATDLEPAELYHACGSLAVAAALAARSRDRRAGRMSHVVYDAIDDVASGNNVLGMPGVVRSMIRFRERRWARAADARVTVNDALADRLARRWGTSRPVVVPNWPERTLAPDDSPSDLIRHAAGISAATRIVIFQGRLGPNLGLDEAAEAVLRVPDAALVLIGFGRGEARSRARDADPRYAGRHVTLPAVHPDELLAWTASADVALVPLPPVSANQRASTPNKFWEAIAAGTPLVIGPDLPVMAALVRAHDLGVVAPTLAPDDLAGAIRLVLDVPPEVAAERRRRIAAVARAQFSWRAAADRYRALVVGLGEVRPGKRPEDDVRSA